MDDSNTDPQSIFNMQLVFRFQSPKGHPSSVTLGCCLIAQSEVWGLGFLSLQLQNRAPFSQGEMLRKECVQLLESDQEQICMAPTPGPNAKNDSLA